MPAWGPAGIYATSKRDEHGISVGHYSRTTISTGSTPLPAAARQAGGAWPGAAPGPPAGQWGGGPLWNARKDDWGAAKPWDARGAAPNGDGWGESGQRPCPGPLASEVQQALVWNSRLEVGTVAIVSLKFVLVNIIPPFYLFSLMYVRHLIPQLPSSPEVLWCTSTGCQR